MAVVAPATVIGLDAALADLVAPPLLEVRGLTVRYAGEDGPVTAVRDVSFTLLPGQALGVVGESGSGKSSIAGAVLDLLGSAAEVEGRILFEGPASGTGALSAK